MRSVFALSAALLVAGAVSVEAAPVARKSAAKPRVPAKLSQFQLTEALVTAAGEGNIARIRRLVAQGAKINARDQFGNTPLEFAARERGGTEILRVLLDLGADPNGPGREGRTALMHSALWGLEKEATLLLSRGANVNQQSPDGATALILAAGEDYPEMAQLLLDKGADINARGKNYGTAVEYAARRGRSDVLPILMARSKLSETERAAWKQQAREVAFIDSARKGDLERVKAFLGQGMSVRVHNAEGETALIAATRGGETALARLLLQKGAEVNAVDESGQTALAYAVILGDTSFMRALIAKGADPNLPKPEPIHGFTPLLTALVFSTEGVARALVEGGADVNAASREGTTPLMLAINKTDLTQPLDMTLIRLLVEKGANVNAKDQDGRTALMMASYRDQLPIAALLIEKGADVNARVGDMTALSLARGWSKTTTPLMKLLQDAGAK